MKGLKYDDGKPRWDLLPIEEVEDVVKVLTFGAVKYAPDNWKHVKDAKWRYLAAAFRHIVARMKGEIFDKETGLPHLAHAIACLFFHAWHDKHGEAK